MKLEKRFYTVKDCNRYNLLTVKEDMLTAKGVVSDVTTFIKRNSAVRVVVEVSKNSLSFGKINELTEALNTIDSAATECYVPVTLSVCNCCRKEFSELTRSPRWRSRWETHGL